MTSAKVVTPFRARGGAEGGNSGRAQLVSYLAELVSQGLIEAELRRVGFTVKPLTRKRKGFGRFLERMAESNQKTFGGQPLDCCSLQEKKPARRRF